MREEESVSGKRSGTNVLAPKDFIPVVGMIIKSAFPQFKSLSVISSQDKKWMTVFVYPGDRKRDLIKHEWLIPHEYKLISRIFV